VVARAQPLRPRIAVRRGWAAMCSGGDFRNSP
jgi:hypothetical protein